LLRNTGLRLVRICNSIHFMSHKRTGVAQKIDLRIAPAVVPITILELSRSSSLWSLCWHVSQ
jgi:hypothetical protein